MKTNLITCPKCGKYYTFSPQIKHIKIYGHCINCKSLKKENYENKKN
jgi:hypothetical protein